MSDKSSRPNVILVLTDDQGYGDVSRLGNPVLRTPALDRLHDESVRFTDFHVAPVCTPTRGELLTGCDALRNCATFVCMGRSLLRADLPTMADIFADNGYATGHFGKWHLGDNYPYRPQDRGFQETVWHPGWGITSAPDFFENDYFDDRYRHRDEIEEYRGYCTDVWFEQATAWMSRRQQAREPFFTYLATNAPHGPLWVPDHYRQPYVDQVQRNEASFFGMIGCIDDNMARLDAFLKDSGLYDDTILMFMTDNGTATGQDVFNAGMRGKKASLYDGGHRVPFFLRWPAAGLGGAGGSGGRDVTVMARGTDLLPTLIDLCALSGPEGSGFDGTTLGGVLRGESGAADTGVLAERIAVVQYGHTNQHIVFGRSGHQAAAVLSGTWRLVNGSELYDVANDPAQQHDVAARHPDVVARLRDHYAQWWDGVGENFDRYQPITIGAPQENPMRLCSPDWAWAYADNQNNIRGCVMDSGVWHVEVAAGGQYAFTLRRWPQESGLGIAAAAPVMEGVDGSFPEGRALPAASAWLRAGAGDQRQPVAAAAAEVTFRMALDPGPTQIKSWWIDADGNRLAGAYYLTAEHLSA